MKCERCTADTYVTPYGVDGYVGHVCEGCRQQWDELRDRY